MKPSDFLPRIVLEHDREKPWREWVTGTVLFADASGFTPLSEDLSVLGAEGAEILTQILNRYFAAMIGIIHAHGGQVMKFGGDALQCFFPESGSPLSGGGRQMMEKRGLAGGEDGRAACLPARQGRLSRNSKLETRNTEAPSLYCALRAARLMQERMARFQNIKTPVKRFTLKMKIGLAHGECLLAGVGDPAVRCDYLFAGTPVDAASEAEHHAAAGEIIVSCSRTLQGAQDLTIQNAKCKMEELKPGFWRVLDVPGSLVSRLPSPEVRRPTSGYRLPASASSYMIPEVHAMVAAGYAAHVGALLDVVPAFLRFEGFRYTRKGFDLETFHRFFTALMEITQRYDGRLSQLSVGDKGSHLLVLFGAPNALEKKEQLASQWALDAQGLVKEKYPERPIRIGIHAGRSFAGIVGGAGRSGYTVMGDAVNTAARLMQGARSGQACLSGIIAGMIGTSFECPALGRRRFKGKAGSLMVHTLSGKRRTTRALQPRGALAGRERELREALDRIGQARKGRPGMLVLEGEPGVGKSHLAGHILSSLDKTQWEVRTTKGEISRQAHPYAPWLDLLATRVFGEKAPDWGALKASGGNRGKVFLAQCAELLGITIPKSVRRSKYDQESRKRLFHREFAEWLLENATRKPLLLFLDDLHWFDTLSMELLTTLMNRLKDQPLFVLAASRSGWNKKEFENRPAFQCIPLTDLDAEGIRQLAQPLLQGRVHDALVKHLQSTTQGNPFFAEQYLQYLKTQGSLELRLGEWRMRRGMKAKEAASGGDIVLARLNALFPSQRVHLQMAACIGPVFSMKVLEAALKPDFDAPAFEVLIRQGLIVALSKTDAQHNTHAFSHALLQETAYRSIPGAARKRNHGRIGTAMETLFAKEIASLRPNLSDHFALAGNRPKTITHAWAAGKALYDGLSFPESVIHLERAHTALKHSRKDKRSFPVGLTLADAYIRTGRYNDSVVLTKRIQRHAARFRDWNSYYKAILSRFDAMQRMGNYTYYRQGIAILQEDNNKQLFRKQLLYFLGLAEYRRGSFDRAEGHLLQAFSCKYQTSLHPSFFLSLMLLASIEKKRSNYARASRHILFGIEKAKKYSTAYQIMRLEIEYANILFVSKKYSEAKAIFSRLIPCIEEYGDYYLLAGVLLNMGDIEQRVGKWNSAMHFLMEAARLFEFVSALGGQAVAYSWMGVVLFHQGQYEEAHERYLQSIRLFEQTNEMTEACHGYYNLAEVCLKLGKDEEAQTWFKKGIRSFRSEDNPKLYSMFQELRDQLEQRSATHDAKI